MTKLPKALCQNSKNVRLTDLRALVCFCCGGIHHYVEEVAEQGEINLSQEFCLPGIARVEEANDFKPQHDHPSHKKLRPEGYST